MKHLILFICCISVVHFSYGQEIDIVFKKQRTTLEYSEKLAIDHLVYNFKSDTSSAILLRGYVENRPGGMRLSWDRANTIALYLIKNGVPDNKIHFGACFNSEYGKVTISIDPNLNVHVPAPPHPTLFKQQTNKEM